MASDRITCDFCNGSGETSSFKGESRFLLTTEECPVCGGMGFVIPEDGAAPPNDDDRSGRSQSGER